MRFTVIPKISLILFSLHMSGCAVSGCNLVKSKGFTLTFIDSKGIPLANIVTKCSGKEAGSTIAAGYNELNLTSNANGEIVFPGKKFGSTFTYRSIGIFSWGYKSSETKITCAFLAGGKEVYKSEFLTSQKPSVIQLEI